MYSEPIIRKSLREWWKRQRTANGSFFATRKLAGLVWEFVRDSMPDRRRQRYGDVNYDWERRVDTTGATVGWRTRLLGLLHSSYQPIEPELFREILGSLVVDFSRFTFIDIGSGKGRALLLAAEYPFRRIVGIELLPELNQIARENIAKLSTSHWQGKSLEAIDATCGNAVDFDFPCEPLMVFLFNPLPEAELITLVKNLDGSLRKDPRLVYVVYVNPVFAQTLGNSELLTICSGTHQYAVFRTAVQ